MKTSIITVFMALYAITGFSQQGRVNIEQPQGVSKLLDLYKAVNSESDFYTIQVGFGSYEKAEKLKADVDVDFPGWDSKIIFDSPTYRVHIGRFRTKLEAERKFLEVRKKYPESLLLNP
jgi:hypothetical protein